MTVDIALALIGGLCALNSFTLLWVVLALRKHVLK